MSESTPSASTADIGATLLSMPGPVGLHLKPSALYPDDLALFLEAGQIALRKRLTKEEAHTLALWLVAWYGLPTRIATDEEVAQDLTQEA